MISDIDIKETPETPTISLDATNGNLLIAGRSIIENSHQFYKPLITELSKCVKAPLAKMEIDFKLEYFNTNSSKSILDVLKVLQEINSRSNNVVINWYYEEGDEDVLEIGEDFSSIINFPFNIKVIPN